MKPASEQFFKIDPHAVKRYTPTWVNNMIEFFIIHQEPVNYTVEEQLYMSAYKMMEQHGQPASDILTELDNRRQEIRQLPAQTEDVLVLKENLGKTASIRNSIVRGSVYAVY